MELEWESGSSPTHSKPKPDIFVFVLYFITCSRTETFVIRSFSEDEPP